MFFIQWLKGREALWSVAGFYVEFSNRNSIGFGKFSGFLCCFRV